MTRGGRSAGVNGDLKASVFPDGVAPADKRSASRTAADKRSGALYRAVPSIQGSKRLRFRSKESGLCIHRGAPRKLRMLNCLEKCS